MLIQKPPDSHIIVGIDAETAVGPIGEDGPDRVLGCYCTDAMGEAWNKQRFLKLCYEHALRIQNTQVHDPAGSHTCFYLGVNANLSKLTMSSPRSATFQLARSTLP